MARLSVWEKWNTLSPLPISVTLAGCGPLGVPVYGRGQIHCMYQWDTFTFEGVMLPCDGESAAVWTIHLAGGWPLIKLGENWETSCEKRKRKNISHHHASCIKKIMIAWFNRITNPYYMNIISEQSNDDLFFLPPEPTEYLLGRPVLSLPLICG